MSVDVRRIWSELSQDRERAEVFSGYVFRRLAPGSPFDIRLAIEAATSAKALFLALGDAATPLPDELPDGRGFEVALDTVPVGEHAVAAIRLRPRSSRFDDVFASLTQDVVTAVARASDGTEAVRVLLERLHRWKTFMQTHPPEGLTDEEQRGLFGELWLLRSRICPAVGPRSAAKAWTGPADAPHDFQGAGWSIEVKTSVGAPSWFFVNCESQLEELAAGPLYLCSVVIDEVVGSGISLPELVAAVRIDLGSDEVAAQTFEDKLIDAGYLYAHERRYDGSAYRVARIDSFHVHGDFPRIRQRSLALGVTDVKYRVSVEACRAFAVTQDEIVRVVGGGTR